MAGANQLSEYELQRMKNMKRNAMMYAELCCLDVWVCGCVGWWVCACARLRTLLGGVCEYVSIVCALVGVSIYVRVFIFCMTLCARVCVYAYVGAGG